MPKAKPSRVTHFLNEPFQVNQCGICKSTVLNGFVDGFAIKCSPEPLDIKAEITAMLAGLRTYELHISGGLVIGWFRDYWQMKSDGYRQKVVVAEHLCSRETKQAWSPSGQWNAAHSTLALPASTMQLHSCPVPCYRCPAPF